MSMTVRKIRTYLSQQLHGAMMEFNTFDSNTTTTARIRNSERIVVLERIIKQVGGVRRIHWKKCAVADCNTMLADVGRNHKYCSNACRQRAYRLRKKL